MHKQRVAKYLKKYVKDFKSDQVSSNMLSGEFELRNVELEPEPVNAKLVGVLPYTISVHKVVCESLRVSIPWTKLRSRSLKVQVGGCHAHVKVHEKNDMDWILRSVKAEKDHMIKTAARAEPMPEAVEGATPPLKLRELKVVITDGLVVSIASLDLVVLSPNPAANGIITSEADASASARPPDFVKALTLRISNISLAPCGPDGQVTDRPGAARQCVRASSAPANSPPSLTTLHRRIVIGSLEARSSCKLGPSECPVSKEMNILSATDIAVSVMETRDLKQVADKDASLMCGFVKDVRTIIELPHLEVKACCHRVGSLVAVAQNAAAPTLVPIEELPVEQRYMHWSHPAARAEMEEAAQAQKAAARRWKTKVGKDTLAKKGGVVTQGGSKAAAAAVKGAGMAAGAAGQVARMSSTGAIKTAGVASSALKRTATTGMTAAKGASGAASGAAAVAQRKGFGALASVAASGRAAAGAASRVAVGTKQAASSKAANAAGRISGRVPVPWKRNNKQQARDAVSDVASTASGADGEIEVSEDEEEEPPTPSLPCVDEDQEAIDGDPLNDEGYGAAEGELESEAGDPSQSQGYPSEAMESGDPPEVDDGASELGREAGEEAESESSLEEEVEDDLKSVADDAAQAEALKALRANFAPAERRQRQSLDTLMGPPPPLTKRVAVHVMLTAAHAVLHGKGAEEDFLAEVGGIDATIEDLSRLSIPEMKSLEAFGLVERGTAQATKEQREQSGEGSSNSLGGNQCVTLGSARVSFHGPSNFSTELFHQETTGVTTPWLLVVRSGTPSAKEMTESGPHIEGCVHGVRATVAPQAIKAAQGVLEEVQAQIAGAGCSNAVPDGDAGAMVATESSKASKICAAPTQPAKASPTEIPAMPLPFISLLLRDVGLEMLSDTPASSLKVVVPGVRIVSGTTSPKAKVSALPSVPAWHSRKALPPSDVKARDLNVYSYICSGYDTAVAEDTSLVVERQWRLAAEGSEPLEVLVPAKDFLHLSEAKLRLAELSAECDALSEKWHANLVNRVASETARRMPMVRELLQESVATVDAQLSALQVEARSLEDGRQEDLANMRSQERQAATAVGLAHISRIEREGDLTARLEEESGPWLQASPASSLHDRCTSSILELDCRCQVTASLASLVAQQAPHTQC